MTGATGLIGRELGKKLVRDGHDLLVLSRSKSKPALPFPADFLSWDGQSLLNNQELSKIDAVVNLAGAPVNARWTTQNKKEIFDLLNHEAVAELIQILPTILEGKIVGQQQDHTQATHCSKITKEDGEIILGKDDLKNWNKWRAYEGWPGVYTFGIRDGKRVRVIIKDAMFVHGIFTPTRVTPEGGKEIDFAQAKKSISFER
jgi:hypothetical protein